MFRKHIARSDIAHISNGVHRSVFNVVGFSSERKTLFHLWHAMLFIVMCTLPIIVVHARSVTEVRKSLNEAESTHEQSFLHSAATDEQLMTPASTTEDAVLSDEPSSEESVSSVVHEKEQENTLPATQSIVDRSHSAVGVYLTPSSVARDDFFQHTLASVEKADGNALVFDVKGSFVYFDADTPIADALGLVHSTYDLPAIIAEAHRRGIYVIGRYISVKDAGYTSVRPDSLIANPTTGRPIGYNFIDPENPDALQYNKEVICSLAKAGIDEINLDYIRFSTEQVGELRVFSKEEKSRKIGVFIKMARDTINECGSATKLGISSYAIIGWNYEKNVTSIGQDIIAFAPMLDIISPMAYPATFAENAYYTPGVNPGPRPYYLVWKTMEGYKELLGPDQWKKLRPWIQGYGLTMKEMRHEMRAVYDAGLCGFTIWNADNAYASAYKAMENWQRPDGCVNN